MPRLKRQRAHRPKRCARRKAAARLSRPSDLGPRNARPAPPALRARSRGHSTAPATPVDSPCGPPSRARRPSRVAGPMQRCRQVHRQEAIRRRRVPIAIRGTVGCRPVKAGRLPAPANGVGRPRAGTGQGTRTAEMRQCSGCVARRRTTGARLRAVPPGRDPPVAGHPRNGRRASIERIWAAVHRGRGGASAYRSRASLSAAPTYAAGVRSRSTSFSSRGIASDSMKRTSVP